MRIYSAFNHKPIDEMTHYELLLERDFYEAMKTQYPSGSGAAKQSTKAMEKIEELIKQYQLTDLLTGTDTSGVVPPYEQNQDHQADALSGIKWKDI